MSGDIKYEWKYRSLGGVARISLERGEDIAHLDELDQKMWTVLSCPASGLEFDARTLKLLDQDGDGKIRIPEVVATAKWLTSMIKDKDLILKGDSSICLDQINTETDEGQGLYDTSKHILQTLGLKKNEISLTDALETCHNIGDIDRKIIFPFGDNTDAALAACESVDLKIRDFFIRCRLIEYNEKYSDSVDTSHEKIRSICDKNLAEHLEDIAQYPLSLPASNGILPFEGINPGWQKNFETLKALVLDVDFPGKKEINEHEWIATMAKFDAYKAWKSKTPDNISSVCKFLLLYRDFYRFLCNYVTFSDFYSTHPHHHAIFEAGRLYIDQRCCKLCIKVEDMSQHTEMPVLSGMFLIYCHCVSRKLNKTMEIVAIMTDGSTADLRPGKNGIFYDLKGQDWDAVVTKIVENPISIKHAFWSPYLKFWAFCKGILDKSAKDKETEVVSAVTDKPAPFDIAKFAGIFAALGMAIGYIGSFFTKLIAGVTSTPVWETLSIILGLLLCISGPSCFIAWTKLRRRNLGPVLNANGWAINSSVLINILFGAKLTSIAKYPLLTNTDDPYEIKRKTWWKLAIVIIVIIAIIFAVLYFTGTLSRIYMRFN